jgi:hypothetical protein
VLDSQLRYEDVWSYKAETVAVVEMSISLLAVDTEGAYKRIFTCHVNFLLTTTGTLIIKQGSTGKFSAVLTTGKESDNLEALGITVSLLS